VGVIEPDSPAAQGGIQTGDLIRAVDRRAVETWEELLIEIMGRRPGRDVGLTVQRAGKTLDVVVRPVAKGRYEAGNIGVLPDVGPRVASLFPGDPAEHAGVRPGDMVIAVNGERVVFAQQLSEALRRSAGKQVELLVRREGRELRFEMTPESREDYPAWIGISMGEATRPFKPGPLEAVQLSVERNIESSGLIFRTLGGLFTGATSVRQLQGPVGIAQLSGESAQEGFIALLSLMAMLSINLGILNLMPVPVLDGGHILIMALEGIARRDFSMRAKEKMLLAGFVMLMMLMVTVIYNDLTRVSWIERFMPWRN
jgi:regulator of sigma E protease